MKKSIDTKLALYPTPVTIVGTMNGDKPTWTLVAHIGIIGHDRILVSLAEPHYINHLIRENGTPIIKAANLTPECSVDDIYKTPNFESFICTIDNTYVEESCHNDKGKPDYTAVKPVLFEFPNYHYLRTGDVIGKCLSFKNK